MTHTPGPWRVEANRNGKYIRLDSSHILAESSIAKVMNGRCFLTAEANARLIAAAPELLEALKALVSTVETQCPTPNNHAAIAAIGSAQAKARAAIAKAEGK